MSVTQSVTQSVPVKRLAFVRRAAGVAAADFADAWRREVAQRIAEAAGAAPLARAHCIGRDQRDAAPHHGVAIEWFADDAALTAFDAAGTRLPPSASATVESAPAVRVRARYVSGDDAALAQWRADAAGAAPRTPVLIGLIQREPRLTRAAFADYWWSRHRPLADALVPAELGPAVYVHNYVLDREPGEWDGVGELYERSLDTARLRGEWFASDAAAELIADEERFLVRATRALVVCDQELVWSSAG